MSVGWMQTYNHHLKYADQSQFMVQSNQCKKHVLELINLQGVSGPPTVLKDARDPAGERPVAHEREPAVPSPC